MHSFGCNIRAKSLRVETLAEGSVSTPIIADSFSFDSGTIAVIGLDPVTRALNTFSLL